MDNEFENNAQCPMMYVLRVKLRENVGTSLVVDGRDGLSLFDLLTSTFVVAAADYVRANASATCMAFFFLLYVLLYMKIFTFWALINNNSCIHGYIDA